jgi:hypothetical protein
VESVVIAPTWLILGAFAALLVFACICTGLLVHVLGLRSIENRVAVIEEDTAPLSDVRTGFQQLSARIGVLERRHASPPLPKAWPRDDEITNTDVCPVRHT